VSLRVEVVPEDPRHNGAILKPLFERMLHECGRPNADVEVLTSPRIRGITHLQRELPGIIGRYGWKHIIIVVIDSDGADRSGFCQTLEAMGRDPKPAVFACAAVQEVETWLLAGHAGRLSAPWAAVRDNPRVKEDVFQPFLELHGNAGMPSGGREELMRQGLENYASILQRCPELADLEARVRNYLQRTR
jgi:hypothetical protein